MFKVIFYQKRIREKIQKYINTVPGQNNRTPKMHSLRKNLHRKYTKNLYWFIA